MTRSKKILLADDNAGIRNLLFDALSSQGFDVTLARDGRESLDQMKNNRFALLITDLDMPRLDGIGLLKIMKRTGRDEKVIIITGNSVDHTHLGKDFPPVFTHLDKPFCISNFLNAVTSALALSA